MYEKDFIKMKITTEALKQKIGQFFFPAVFINDTEENIQETERLIKEHNIGGLTFFTAVQALQRTTKARKKLFLTMTAMRKLKY